MKIVFLFFFLSSLFVTASATGDQANSKQIEIISAYSNAWNTKNISQMAALMHPDIEWLSVNDSIISVESKGKTQLVEAMREWFTDTNLTTGSLRDWSVNGNFVAVTETAAWLDKSQKNQSQSSLTVYELQNNLIRRVYYYPSVKN